MNACRSFETELLFFFVLFGLTKIFEMVRFIETGGIMLTWERPIKFVNLNCLYFDIESTQWEASCSYETTTLTHYCDWLRQDGQPHTSLDTPQGRQGDNPLLRYDQDTHWCYVDYNYMAELFEGHADILKVSSI